MVNRLSEEGVKTAGLKTLLSPRPSFLLRAWYKEREPTRLPTTFLSLEGIGKGGSLLAYPRPSFLLRVFVGKGGSLLAIYLAYP